MMEDLFAAVKSVEVLLEKEVKERKRMRPLESFVAVEKLQSLIENDPDTSLERELSMLKRAVEVKGMCTATLDQAKNLEKARLIKDDLLPDFMLDPIDSYHATDLGKEVYGIIGALWEDIEQAYQTYLAQNNH